MEKEKGESYIHTYMYMHTFYVYLLLIRWQRSWGLAHRCCQLQSLSRLAEQNPEALINLQGKCSNNNVLTDMDAMDFLFNYISQSY